MPIGYHYTPLSNLPSIRTVGLEPRQCPAHILPKILAEGEGDEFSSWNRRGIWCWTKELSPESHAGTVMFCAQKSGCAQTAVLRVEYDASDLLRTDCGAVVKLTHRGAIGGWVYHTAEPAVFLINRVPLSRLQLIGTYDVVQALRPKHVSAEPLGLATIPASPLQTTLQL